MLGLNAGLIIHADGKKVAVEIITDALHYGTDLASHFEVYRRRHLTPKFRQTIAKTAVRYYSQKYRFSPFFLDVRKRRKEDTTQFCSRLVANAYRSAGLPISSLSDQKTLPIDLYQACQSDDWENITANFLERPIETEVSESAGTIDIPGLGQMTLADFLAHSDELILDGARRSKDFYELQYKTMKDQLEAEELIEKFCALLFELAKKTYIKPAKLDHRTAERIVTVLRQLEPLLDLSLMPTLDILVRQPHVDELSSSSPYAGFPKPATIREMQRTAEAVRIYANLTFAEVGLFSILANRTQNEKFDRFRRVKPEFVQAFVTALPPLTDLSIHEGRNLFEWVDDQSDRAMCCTRFANIVSALRTFESLRSSGQGTPASGPAKNDS
jgi:hypothetical protein